MARADSEDRAAPMVPVGKKSKGKNTLGGRKFAMRRLGEDGRAEAGAQGDPAGETTPSQHHLPFVHIHMVRDPEDVRHTVLAVGVGAHHHLIRMEPTGMGETGLQRMSLAAVAVVADHLGPMDARQCEDLVEIGPGTVVDDKYIGSAWVGPEFTHEGDQPVTGFIGRDQDEHRAHLPIHRMSEVPRSLARPSGLLTRAPLNTITEEPPPSRL